MIAREITKQGRFNPRCAITPTERGPTDFSSNLHYLFNQSERPFVLISDDGVIINEGFAMKNPAG